MFRKFLFSFINLLIITVCSIVPISGKYFPNSNACGNICPSSIVEKIIRFFKPYEGSFVSESQERKMVYISGRPIGFSIDGGGVVVVTLGEIKTSNGYIASPCKDAGVKEGDIILKADGMEISSGERLIDIVNSRDGKSVEIELLRDGKHISVEITLMYDTFALSYRLGVWVRDNAVGVGTVTYVTEDGRFSALGHPVTDSDTSTIFPVGVGKIYKCSIVGIKKGEKGNPGELKGLFFKNSNTVGSIELNENDGIRGVFESAEVSEEFRESEPVEVAFKNEVRPGLAKIYTTIDGSVPSEYEIEIIKTNHVNNYGKKCMVIRITDDKLLNNTNGIVQGMSGSPIIQDGRLVGTVTHVFINDPTKGFADFIDVK